LSGFRHRPAQQSGQLLWIGFYNDERLHEELGDLLRAEYEMINYKTGNTPILSAR